MANVENPVPFENPDFQMIDSPQLRYMQLVEQSPLSEENQAMLEGIISLSEADRGDRIELAIWNVNQYFIESCGIGAEYREHLRLRFRLEFMRGGTIYEPK